MTLTPVILQHLQPLDDIKTGGESIFTCRAPSKKGSMRGHMLTLSASISEEKNTCLTHDTLDTQRMFSIMYKRALPALGLRKVKLLNHMASHCNHCINVTLLKVNFRD